MKNLIHAVGEIVRGLKPNTDYQLSLSAHVFNGIIQIESVKVYEQNQGDNK